VAPRRNPLQLRLAEGGAALTPLGRDYPTGPGAAILRQPAD
jgi:hypothetical protein